MVIVEYDLVGDEGLTPALGPIARRSPRGVGCARKDGPFATNGVTANVFARILPKGSTGPTCR